MTSLQPQPDPSLQPGEPPRIHVHHSYIWLGTMQVSVLMFIAVFGSLFSPIMSALESVKSLNVGFDIPTTIIVIVMMLIGFFLLIAIIALFLWWSYKHLYYQLGTDEFNLYSGIFNKKRVHVPYPRIQSVDQRASLLQRIFGVCSVSIDTAGGSANKAIMVPYVSKMQAEELRHELFARKQHAAAVQAGAVPAKAAQAFAATMPGAVVPAESNVLDAPAEIWQDVRGVFGGKFVDTGHVTYEYGLTNKELVLTGLSNNTAFIIVVIGIVGGVAQLAGEVVSNLAGSVEPVLGHLFETGSQLFGGNLIALAVASFLGVSIFLWAISAVGSCISYGGFRACRRDNRIEVEHGLLQHQFQGVDIARVQSVVVKQSFIRRLMGYCELSLGKIDAVTEGQDKQKKGLSQQGVIIHPFVKLNRVPEILAGLVPEFADVPVQNTPVAPVALRRALIRRCIIQGSGFWLAIFITICFLFSSLLVEPGMPGGSLTASIFNMLAFVGYALCVALLVFDIAGAILWYRGSGFAYNDHFMQVSNGGLARESVSFPRKKIQFGYTKTNPFQRNAHTATVNVRTAAGVGGTTIRLIDATEEDARAWLEWLIPQGNVIQ